MFYNTGEWTRAFLSVLQVAEGQYKPVKSEMRSNITYPGSLQDR